MVTVRFRALSALAARRAALLLAACGNAAPSSPAIAGSPTGRPPPRRARPRPSPHVRPRTRSPAPAAIPNPAAAFIPAPPASRSARRKAVTVDGIIEEGVEPGCKVLTAGNTMYLILGGKDVPIGVPVRVEGVLQPGVLSTCQQGTPLRVTSVKRR